MSEFGRSGPSGDARRAGELAAHLNSDALYQGMDVCRPDLRTEVPAAATDHTDALGPPPANRVPSDGERNYPPRPEVRSGPAPQGDTPTASGPPDRGGPPPDTPGTGGEAGDPRHNSLQLFRERAAQPPRTPEEARAAFDAHGVALDLQREGLRGFNHPRMHEVARGTADGATIASKIANGHLAKPALIAAQLEIAAHDCRILEEYVQQTGDRAIVVSQPSSTGWPGAGLPVGQLDVRNVLGRVDWSEHVPSDLETADNSRAATFKAYPASETVVDFVNGSSTELIRIEAIDDRLTTTVSHAYTLPPDTGEFLQTLHGEITAYTQLLRQAENEPTADPASLHEQATASVSRIAALLQGQSRGIQVPDTVDLEALTSYLLRNSLAVRDSSAKATAQVPAEYSVFERLAAHGPATREEQATATRARFGLDAHRDLAQSLQHDAFLGNDLDEQTAAAGRLIEDYFSNPGNALARGEAALTIHTMLDTYVLNMVSRPMLTSSVTDHERGASFQAGQFIFHVTSTGLLMDRTDDPHATANYLRYDTPDGTIRLVGSGGTQRVSIRETDGGVTVTHETIHRITDGTANFLARIGRALERRQQLLTELAVTGNAQNVRGQLVDTVRTLAALMASPYNRLLMDGVDTYIQAVANSTPTE